MTASPADTFESALRAAAAFLAALPSPGMVIGGMAVIAHGHIRTTQDIDATVSGEGTSPEQILAVAATHGFEPRMPGALDFARRTQVILLVHRATRVPLDLSLAWLPFELEALRRGQVVELGGAGIRVCSPEDLVIYKLVAARPTDLSDVRQLFLRHHARIDRTRVQGVLAEFDQALEDGRSRVTLWHAIQNEEPGTLRRADEQADQEPSEP